MKKYVTLDTNVLISGYLWKGKSRQALQLIKSGAFEILYCDESLNELIKVLSLKFGLTAEEIYRITYDIQSSGKRIKVTSCENPIKKDLSDNLFINLALDGKAKIIVSGDSHLLNLKRYKGIEIISVANFIKRHS